MNERSLLHSGKSILTTLYVRHSVRAFAPTPLESFTVQTLLGPAVHASMAMHEESRAFAIGFAVSALNIHKVKTEPGIPDEYSAIAPIAVGVPGGEPTVSTRKEPFIISWKK